MTRTLPNALLAGLAMVSPTAAQDGSTAGDIGDVWRDVWFVVGSPAHASRADLRTAGLVAAGTGVVLLMDETVHGWVHSNPTIARVLSPFRGRALLGYTGRTQYFLLPLSIGMYGAGHLFGSSDLRDAGLGCATSNLTTTLTRTSTARFVVGRARPSLRQGPYAFDLLKSNAWDNRSFPSGHASNIMSCVSFFNHRFDLGVAGPLMWLLAAAVGAGRVLDDEHWASDTAAGMAFGYAVGLGVANRSLERDARGAAERSMRPGITLQWRITF